MARRRRGPYSSRPVGLRGSWESWRGWHKGSNVLPGSRCCPGLIVHFPLSVLASVGCGEPWGHPHGAFVFQTRIRLFVFQTRQSKKRVFCQS